MLRDCGKHSRIDRISGNTTVNPKKVKDWLRKSSLTTEGVLNAYLSCWADNLWVGSRRRRGLTRAFCFLAALQVTPN